MEVREIKRPKTFFMQYPGEAVGTVGDLSSLVEPKVRKILNTKKTEVH